MTSLGHNQDTGIMFIQASEHPSCGTRGYGENYRRTKPSAGWYILVGEEPHAMDVLPHIPHILWVVHGQDLISLGRNQYTGILLWFCFVFFGMLSPFSNYQCRRRKWDNISCHPSYCAPPVAATWAGSWWYPLNYNGYTHLWPETPSEEL